MAKLQDIIARIILGSTLLTGTSKAEVNTSPNFAPSPVKGQAIERDEFHQTIENTPPKLILSQPNLEESRFLLAGHRSHRSHASHYSSRSGHRSHQSHYSSYSSPSSNSGTSSGVESSPGSSLRGNTEVVTPPSQSNKNITKDTGYSLGSRTLFKGSKGSDVGELKRMLAEKGYKLDQTDEYDELTEVTIKDFQSKHNIPIDGKAGPLTIYLLKKK